MTENAKFNDELLNIVNSIDKAILDLDKVKKYVQKIQQDMKREEYKSMPGVEGVFDGFYMVTDAGEKIEVPANYAAKSRLIFGDRLKRVEEDGKQVFKQITKVERKKATGVVSKKEGKWYVLTDSGSYRISDVAADFNGIQLNQEIEVVIPADNLNAPFAALDKVLNQEVKKPDTNLKVEKKEPAKKEIKKEEIAPKKPEQPVKKQKKIEQKEEVKKEFISGISPLEEDDLV